MTLKKVWRLVLRLVGRWFEHDVGRVSAALTYYLIFSIWPFLIFVSTLLGGLDIAPLDFAELGGVIPAEVIDVVNGYILHIGENRSSALLYFGLSFTVYFAMRAVGCLTESVGVAFGAGRKGGFLARQARLLLLTLITLAAMAVTLVIVAAGPTVLSLAAEYIPAVGRVMRVWIPLRFVLLAALVFIMLSAFYALAAGRRDGIGTHIMLATLAALAVWMLISVAFSWYVENVASYARLYGSLGAVIVLLLWLYLTAALMIMGAELAALLEEARFKRKNVGNNTTG